MPIRKALSHKDTFVWVVDDAYTLHFVYILRAELLLVANDSVYYRLIFYDRASK